MTTYGFQKVYAFISSETILICKLEIQDVCNVRPVLSTFCPEIKWILPNMQLHCNNNYDKL